MTVDAVHTQSDIAFAVPSPSARNLCGLGNRITPLHRMSDWAPHSEFPVDHNQLMTPALHKSVRPRRGIGLIADPFLFTTPSHEKKKKR